ncbi:MAG: YidB family protein [Acidobacteriota bacterium]|nr:YidB family protein [Acidobacteriota bacterium]
MGFLGGIVSAAAGAMGGGDHAAVGGGLIQELEQRPGGIGGIFQSFQQNGLGGLVQQWAGGNTAPASPDQIEQGLGGSGIIEGIAQRTGMSPGVVKMSLAVLVPLVIHHVVSNGHVTAAGEPTGAPMPESGGLLQSVLSRLL